MTNMRDDMNNLKDKINNNEIKNCKKTKNNVEKQQNQTNLSNIFDFDETIKYVKILFSAYKSLPKIISVLDTIIEKRASSLMPSSAIYGSTYLNTINQINKVIDLSERKDKLLNLYAITETILNSLEEQDRKFAILKFVQNTRAEEIAKEFKITERSVFRKTNIILTKIAEFMKNNNWGVAFLKHQMGNEPWLEDLCKPRKNSKL